MYTYAVNTDAGNHYQQVFRYTQFGTFENIQEKTKLIASLGDNRDSEGNTVGVEDRRGRFMDWQRWNIVYTDEKDGGSGNKTDEWSKEFGFKVNKAFYIVSGQSGKKVVTVAGGFNLVS
jgi:hypothetical protein